MTKAGMPRHGSMQVWPRKRAKRVYPRVRSWQASKDVNLMGFAGYKVGMTHISIIDNGKTSMTKGEEIRVPVTVVECPPLKVHSVRFYKSGYTGLKVIGEVFAKIDSDLAKRLVANKKESKSIDEFKLEDFTTLRLNVFTQPKMTGFGKKIPEIFEIAVGGTKEEMLTFAKTHLGKEISVSDVFKGGEQVDIHAVTKGYGFQGPVKRFGVQLRSHKSEKTIRGPGSLGGWKGQQHNMYRMAFAGQTGFHTRTDLNKWVIKIGKKGESINPDGGFINYGLVKSDYLLIKGSLPGAKKRLVRFVRATRPNKQTPNQAPTVEYVSLRSKQGC